MTLPSSPRPSCGRMDLAAVDRFIGLMTQLVLQLISAGAITPDDLGYLSDRVVQRLDSLHTNPNHEDLR